MVARPGVSGGRVHRQRGVSGVCVRHTAALHVAGRVPLSVAPGGVEEARGSRYQRDERTKDHAEFLDFADADDVEHHHGEQRGHLQSQQRDEQVGNSPAGLVFQRPRVIAVFTPRSGDFVPLLLRGPVRFRFLRAALTFARRAACCRIASVRDSRSRTPA